MDVRVNRTDGVTREVEIEVEESRVEEAVGRKLRELGRKVRIDGFRKGKVPTAVIKKRYGRSARMEAIEEVVQRVLLEALQNEELEGTIHFSRPEVLEGYDRGAVRFRFQAENFPEIEVAEYAGVKILQKDPAVSADEVDAEIEKLREELTQMVPVEDRKTVASDDVVRLSYQALGEGQVSEIHQEDQEVDLSREDLLDGFADAIVGAEVGVKKNAEIALGDDFPVEDLQGETITLEVEVHEILRRDVPELDDAFARETGRAESLEELRSTIEAELKETREKESRNDARQRLAAEVSKLHEVELPAHYLRQQSEEQVMQQLQMFERQGINWRELQLDVNRMVEGAQQEMGPAMKQSLVLQAIAKKEGFEVSDEDVQAELERIAEENNVPAAQVAAQFSNDDAKAQLRFRLLIDRVLDFVWSKATIEVVDELPDESSDDATESEGQEPVTD